MSGELRPSDSVSNVVSRSSSPIATPDRLRMRRAHGPLGAHPGMHPASSRPIPPSVPSAPPPMPAPTRIPGPLAQQTNRLNFPAMATSQAAAQAQFQAPSSMAYVPATARGGITGYQHYAVADGRTYVPYHNVESQGQMYGFSYPLQTAPRQYSSQLHSTAGAPLYVAPGTGQVYTWPGQPHVAQHGPHPVSHQAPVTAATLANVPMVVPATHMQHTYKKGKGSVGPQSRYLAHNYATAGRRRSYSESGYSSLSSGSGRLRRDASPPAPTYEEWEFHAREEKPPVPGLWSKVRKVFGLGGGDAREEEPMRGRQPRVKARDFVTARQSRSAARPVNHMGNPRKRRNRSR
ncbi:hypothetical protein BKA62DRAFT_771400 [Auriculariales sp. MPI-PUGE-AT-0066]|nr:hypothetical protein BKA62DRAFT_771400 [Auriculariales sp. MPI-PUGE-AT-0066]